MEKWKIQINEHWTVKQRSKVVYDKALNVNKQRERELRERCEMSQWCWEERSQRRLTATLQNLGVSWFAHLIRETNLSVRVMEWKRGRVAVITGASGSPLPRGSTTHRCERKRKKKNYTRHDEIVVDVRALRWRKTVLFALVWESNKNNGIFELSWREGVCSRSLCIDQKLTVCFSIRVCL